ncbi:MAG: hypothetical protein ACYCQM_01780 [Acidithiobacillus sp.]
MREEERRLIGKSNRNRVYEVLNRQRPLTLAMIRRLHLLRKSVRFEEDVNLLLKSG